jgi:hypothetical protein
MFVLWTLVRPVAQANLSGTLRGKAQQHGPIVQLALEQVAQIDMTLVAV